MLALAARGAAWAPRLQGLSRRSMSALDAGKKGGGKKAKPSLEEIAALREAAAARKAAAPAKEATPAAPAKKQEKVRDPAAEAEALRAFAVGGGATVVDIGANLQSRGSFAEVSRQLERAQLAGVERVVLTGCDVEGSTKGRETCERWLAATGGAGLRCYFTAGVHPHDATTWTSETARACEALASTPHCVALGECGLDYDRMFSPRDVQRRVFAAQCALAADLGRALFVHVREVDAPRAPLGAYADALDILRASGVEPRRVCVHCFTGTEAELAAVRAYGARVGFTGFVGIAKRSGETRAAIRNLAAAGHLDVDAGDVLIETDAPFMLPDKAWLPAATSKKLGIRGGKNEPAVLPAVARALADALGADAPHVARATTAAARAFFDFPRADAALGLP